MPVFKTAFQGCSVKFSPFYEHRLAVATTKNFGKNGNGCLHILDLSPTPSSPTPISELTFFDTAEGINDVSWSKSDNNLLVAAFADGSLKLYDTSLPPQQNPCRSFVRHSDEAYSVDWSPKRSNSFISGSFDHTINLWTVDNPTRVRTFKGHDYCVYSVAWNPLLDNVFASASGDYTVRCWDVRNPRSTMTILGNEHEILSCDWNMYDDYLLATGAVDNMVRVWDVRSIRTPIAVLSGHEYAVMKVKFSPHRRNMVMSFSLDYTVCMWDFTVEDALIEKYDLHTDSPGGIDMSFFDEGLLASTAWDGMTYVWQRGTDPRAEGDSMDPQLEMLCGSIMKLEVENKNDTPHTSPVAEPPLCTVGHLTQEKEKKKKKKKKKGPLNIKHCIK